VGEAAAIWPSPTLRVCLDFSHFFRFFRAFWEWSRIENSFVVARSFAGKTLGAFKFSGCAERRAVIGGQAR